MYTAEPQAPMQQRWRRLMHAQRVSYGYHNLTMQRLELQYEAIAAQKGGQREGEWCFEEVFASNLSHASMAILTDCATYLNTSDTVARAHPRLPEPVLAELQLQHGTEPYFSACIRCICYGTKPPCHFSSRTCS